MNADRIVYAFLAFCAIVCGVGVWAMRARNRGVTLPAGKR